MPEMYLEELEKNNIPFEEHVELPGNLENVDVVYMTRVQKERFASPAEYEKVKNSCVIDAHTLSVLPEKCIIMHPLPRVNEIAPEVDADPRALYFKQATNGLYVRMALLELLFEKKTLEQETLKMV